jgi:hypothetical protein
VYLTAARTVDMDGFSLPWGPLSATHNAAICRTKVPSLTATRALVFGSVAPGGWGTKRGPKGGGQYCPSWLDDAAELAHCGLHVGDVVQHVHGQPDIGGRVAQWEALCVRLDEAKVPERSRSANDLSMPGDKSTPKRGVSDLPASVDEGRTHHRSRRRR